MQYYFPLSSDKAITAWVPLQPTPAVMGPLQFAAGSHKVDVGRHLGISGTNQHIIDQVPVTRCSRQSPDVTGHCIPVLQGLPPSHLRGLIECRLDMS